MAFEITPHLLLDERHVSFEFIRAAGPGGQNVNKVSSAVELRFDWANCGLPDGLRQRFAALAGRRLNQDGVLVLKAQRFRSQERNREDAIQRLLDLLREAAEVPIHRRATRPSFGSKQRRLEGKRVSKTIKRGRQRVQTED